MIQLEYIEVAYGKNRPVLTLESLHTARGECVTRTVNARLTLLYWEIGSPICRQILRGRRAEYGKQIFYALSRKLIAEFGRGFSQANLFHIARFAEAFPDRKIVHALSAQLGWTHFLRIIRLDDELKIERITGARA